MTAEQAVRLIQLLEEHQIEVYVDGGWGVDALLGEQTRVHEDLDIAIPYAFVPKLRALLDERGYKEVPRDDTWECNFVLENEAGLSLDVHSYTLDETGENIFGVAYEAHQLTGTGTINGYLVRCIPPDTMVSFHLGYKLDENDYHDVRLLCKRFDIPLPKEYYRFVALPDGKQD